MSKWEKQIKLFCKKNSFEKYEKTIKNLFVQETFKARNREPNVRDAVFSTFTWKNSEQGVDFWVKIDVNEELPQSQKEFFEKILRPYYTEKLDVFELES